MASIAGTTNFELIASWVIAVARFDLPRAQDATVCRVGELENQAGRSTNSISLNGRLTVCARISTKPRFFRTNTVWPRRNIQGVRWDAWGQQ
jgi:hypothetical protein